MRVAAAASSPRTSAIVCRSAWHTCCACADVAAWPEPIAEARGDEAAAATRILYGGSVKSGNIAGFMREADVDGALVGGASLDAAEFAAIARYQQHVGT